MLLEQVPKMNTKKKLTKINVISKKNCLGTEKLPNFYKKKLIIG